MQTTWILVANAAHARLFEQAPGRRLVLVQTFDHSESRLRGSALRDDKAGREQSDQSFGGMAYEPRLSARRKEHLVFAQELARHLEQAALQGRYAALAVFAASPFLGELAQVLGDASRRLLAGVHDVDLSRVGLAEMAQRIREEREGASIRE